MKYTGSSFFGTPRWKYFESEDGQDVVEFTGDCTYQDVPVKARIQFVVDEENGTFEASYLAFNEVPQDALTLAAVIAKAFEGAEAVETGDGQGQSTNTTGQILIRQVPTQDVIGMTADEVIATFGDPEIYSENDSIEYGADAPEWMYFDVSNGNTVASFSANAGEFTLNGQSLKLDFDSLISLIGDDYDSLGAGGYQWIRNGICYTFYIPDDTEESYMAEERDPGGWKVEDCYILEQMRDTAAISNLTRMEQDDGTVCYFFGDTCIRVRESEDNGKIRLELVSGDQTACGEWVELSIDRVYGYCTLLERHLNRKDGNQK